MRFDENHHAAAATSTAIATISSAVDIDKVDYRTNPQAIDKVTKRPTGNKGYGDALARKATS